MGANSRQKGATFERDVARMLFDELGMKFARDLRQYQKADFGDLQCEDPSFPFVVECKRYASNSTNRMKPEWWVQVERAATAAQKMPCLIYKYDRQPIRVVLPLGALITDTDGHMIEMDFEAFAYIARELCNV